MYQDFYSFSAMPFQLTPDSRFYFGSDEHKKALAFLQYGLSQCEGFVVVTGEIGAGKTTLVEHLLATIDPDEYAVARVVTTQLGGYDTLCLIASAFGVTSDGVEKGQLLGRMKSLFEGLQERGKHPVIIIDEAQSLTLDAVEELRMLSNLSAGPRAPFQGIFLGQPEFRVALGQPELKQLRQRVVASCHLAALGIVDTKRYIEHRLHRVEWKGDPAFSDASFEEIYRHSGGIPRRINSLCSRLLLLGFLEERHVIDAHDVSNVAREMAAELGPSADESHIGSASTHEQPVEPSTPQRTDDFPVRLRRVERASERHDRTLVRLLDLALRHLSDKG